MPKNRPALPIFENITISDAGSEGNAVARVDNKVIFIPYVVPGDVVDIQITKKKKSYFEGKALRFHTYSDLRVEPFCEHFGLCGGCRWQHMSYETQLFFKQKQVVDNFRRIGKIENPVIHPIVPSPRFRDYRNKLEFTFSNRRWFTQPKPGPDEAPPDRNALGFHIPAMFDRVLDINRCHLQEEPSNAIRLFIRRYAVENGLAFYDVMKWEGFLRNLIIRNTTTGDLMVILVVRDDHREVITKLLDELIAAFPSITSLYFVINQKKNDVINDLTMNLYHGSPFITEIMDPYHKENKRINFQIGPVSFFQTNGYQAVNVYKEVGRMADFSGNETVYDLYTGTGTIALYIAPYVKRVVGIESVASAVEDARKNARLNGITNAVFFAGEAEKLMNRDFIYQNGHPDLIIADPPRSGMHEKVVRAILDAEPGTIIYVSCNPATQARDLHLLEEKYTIVESRPFDMFPQTHHVENVTLLRRKQASPALI
ncbi:MAG: 23S rRNA (uracil(1939)-C(5))-methyltransferase RlmD [bacterium]